MSRCSRHQLRRLAVKNPRQQSRTRSSMRAFCDLKRLLVAFDCAPPFDCRQKWRMSSRSLSIVEVAAIATSVLSVAFIAFVLFSYSHEIESAFAVVGPAGSIRAVRPTLPQGS